MRIAKDFVTQSCKQDIAVRGSIDRCYLIRRSQRKHAFEDAILVPNDTSTFEPNPEPPDPVDSQRENVHCRFIPRRVDAVEILAVEPQKPLRSSDPDIAIWGLSNSGNRCAGRVLFRGPGTPQVSRNR